MSAVSIDLMIHVPNILTIFLNVQVMTSSRFDAKDMPFPASSILKILCKPPRR